MLSSSENSAGRISAVLFSSLLGLTEFSRNLDRARLADVKRAAQDPNARRLEVEDAMAVTLKANRIELPQSFFTVLSDFHPKFPPQKQ
jgi:hypothetical protein